MPNPTVIRRLEEIVGAEYVLTSEMDRMLYGYDASLQRGTADVVVLPAATEEVAAVVRVAHEEGIPVIGRGSGTNLSGGTVPVRGGIVIHFGRMNRVIEIDIPNRTATVQPGVITLDLQTLVARQGFIYAPDPASQKVSTLGGNFGENAGGPHCLKYGVTTNHILGAEVVFDDGTVTWVGGKAPDPAGYDLTGLLVGSEGTLAIATQIILKLIRAPETVKTMLAIYDTVEDAGNTVSAIIAEGIVPATLEMMDNLVIQAVEDSVQAGYPRDAAAVLIIELDGLADGMQRQADQIMAICERHHVREVTLAEDDAQREELWAGRKGAFGAVSRLRPSYLVCDGTVPRTQLPGVLSKVREVGERYCLPIGNVFHAGDGNLHPLILFDERNPEELERVHTAAGEILKICADAGGTISGEHGIGTEKLKEMAYIFSEPDIDFMRLIKQTMDPLHILNPGKVIPNTA
jgi:glycolate oxidase subunit GlcD